jgi:glycosyltransferase involved in cell wall biosynthesis
LAEGWPVRVICAPGGLRPAGAEIVEVDVSRLVRAAQFTPARFSPAWLRLVGESAHDRRASRLIGECDVFQGAGHCCLRSLRAARKAGGFTVVESMNADARHVDHVMRREETLVGSRAHFHNRLTIARCMAEYVEAGLVYCNSEYTRHSLVEGGLPSDRVAAIPLSVELPARSAEHRPDGLFRALFVGSIDLRKGFRHLLAAWEKLRLPGAELCLRGGTGDRSCRRILEDFRRRIEFTQDLGYGPVPYHEFSVLVLPSLSDGFGLVVPEAMAAGLPVIVSENVGARDCVREGVAGFVVPVADPQAIAARLELLYRDRARLSAMGSAARERAAEFSQEAFRARYVAMVRETIMKR